jgi:putative membrane protein
MYVMSSGLRMLRQSFRHLSLRDGEAPDPRFTLANERTFLAWIRTALALLGGGIAVEAFTVNLLEPVIRTWLATMLISLSATLSAGSCWRWIKVERALRHRQPLQVSQLVPLLTLAVALMGVISALVFWSLT